MNHELCSLVQLHIFTKVFIKVSMTFCRLSRQLFPWLLSLCVQSNNTVFSKRRKQRLEHGVRVHATGCARSEGYYKINMNEKAKYLETARRQLQMQENLPSEQQVECAGGGVGWEHKLHVWVCPCLCQRRGYTLRWRGLGCVHACVDCKHFKAEHNGMPATQWRLLWEIDCFLVSTLPHSIPTQITSLKKKGKNA